MVILTIILVQVLCCLYQSPKHYIEILHERPFSLQAATELDLDSVARGGGIQRGVEWGQVVAGVPRAAVEQREVASGPPQWQAALHCAGSRAKQRGREVGYDCWTCL